MIEEVIEDSDAIEDVIEDSDVIEDLIEDSDVIEGAKPQPGGGNEASRLLSGNNRRYEIARHAI